ncbi:hypothetical protein BH708_09825 [Brachybacterium sp. P6-10-X1]|uniref:DUF6541 family protein n=1 Tax=Brachybacterium sp. P6-10-X1 TaxID=1903186 RepID=UPI000971A6DE|nr:DUF6541 family protein [Brachybacterium sp. P6-10-X1]APX32960.1 hypothetical protein BH708_09825 [Brachybacterium sp. P6-10-X1]
MWTDVIPGVLVAVALLVAPGAAALLCCRVSWPTALVAAPPVSLALLAISTLLAAVVDAAWGLPWMLATTVLGAGACALWSWATPWGRRTPRWSPLSAAAAGQYLVGQVIALIFLVPLFLSAFVEPTTIAQRYDNAFHLNAIETIVRTGEATPFDTGQLLRGAVYPNSWHTAAALVQELSGLGLAQTVHALTLVTVLGIWPLSVWLLVEVLVRPSPVARLVTGPLSLAFAGFPLVLLDWGLVYPTILGLAAAPALAAVLIHLALDRELLAAPVRIAAIIAVMGIGVGIAHPGAALAGLIIALPITVLALVRQLRGPVLGALRRPAGSSARHASRGWSLRAVPAAELGRAAVPAVVAAGIAAVWATMAPSTDTAPWTAFQSTPQALGEAFLGGAMERFTLPLIVVLSALGLLGALLGRGRDRLVLLAMLGPVAVYWASSAAQDAFWRNLLSGFLYRDNFRTAAVLTLVAVPLVVAGVELLLRGLRRAVAAWRAHRTEGESASDASRGAPGALPTAAALVIGVLASTALSWHVSSDPHVQARFETVSDAYRTWEIADLVSGTEFAMFEDLPRHVPEDGYVVTDPWEGGGLAYAFGDREVSRIYMTVKRTPEEKYVDAHLEDIASDPRVCAALPADQPLYYLDLEEHRLGGNKIEDSGYLGFAGITEETPGFDLVHQVGDVRLYEIDAC